MKKLLLIYVMICAFQVKAQSIDQTLLATLTEENAGKFEKTNFYAMTLSDGSKEVVKTSFESYSAIISRDNFVRYYPTITEKMIFELITNVKTVKLTGATTELPVLILNFRLNRNGVYVEVTDNSGVSTVFKNWIMIAKMLERN